MPRTTILIVLQLILLFTVAGCGTKVEVGYQPPIVPVRVSINTDGEINVDLSGNYATPIGVFDIGVGSTIYSFLDDYQNQILLIRVDEKVNVYELEPGKKFAVLFDDENTYYKKVALDYAENGDILLELESVTLQPVSDPDSIQAGGSTPEETWSGTLAVRKPTLNEIRAEVPVSLWDINLLNVRDMTSPGKDSYTGQANSSDEYLFPVYWCATSANQLAQNNEQIRTVFKVDGETIPEKWVFSYDYDTSTGWNCSYHAVVLDEWKSSAQYKLQAVRTLLADISDGETDYKAGEYVFELVVNTR